MSLLILTCLNCKKRVLLPAYPPIISHATSGVKVIYNREKMDSELACIDTALN